ncbi:MAG: hypothetical protein HYV08_02655 [Deltaproteobacteria bacterium]|nr:hypothetical protein [Deltaproteobacteria bacterium]MBI3076218.1 hypothetical protein [Deltaproteobacteria bacterium]
MTDGFPSLPWAIQLQATANEDAEFAGAARWFDGSVFLRFGSAAYWMKIYGGRVIDVQAGPSPLGFTFAIGGEESVWRELLRDPRNRFLEFAAAGRLSVEGNLLEYMRITKAVIRLIEAARKIGEARP